MTVLRRVGRFIGHRRAIPFGVRDRVLRRLWPPDLPKDETFSTVFADAAYEGCFDNFIDWMVWFYGGYELGLSNWMGGALRKIGVDRVPTFWDVGAHSGVHALAMAKFATVHAFEPQPVALRSLRRNCELNADLPITVHEFGLAETDDVLPFFVPMSTNRGTGSFLTAGEVRSPLLLHLRVRQGDQLVRDGVANDPDLIKIDVEGFERQVLDGLRRTLLRVRPIVVTEVGGNGARHVSVTDVLDRMPPGYAAYAFSYHPERLMAAPLHQPRVAGLVLIPEASTVQFPEP